MNILPVYRTSEGVENLSENYNTFNKCIELFRQNGIVMIFSEGKCINEWHLRSLKKGTARLAIQAWEENIPLKVLPVGINYNSFRSFGKNIFINFGTIILKKDIDFSQADGLRHQAFNNILKSELELLVFEIDSSNEKEQQRLLTTKISRLKRFFLAIPALLGYLIHSPLYIPIRQFSRKKTLSTDHYDSVLTAILLITYPLALLIITITLWALTKWIWLLLILFIFPFTAWSYVQLKDQTD